MPGEFARAITAVPVLVAASCTAFDDDDDDDRADEWVLRLDDGWIAETCDGEYWDGEDDLPDPQVTVEDARDGAWWVSAELEDTLEPAWSQAAWEGAPLAADHLRDFGLLVRFVDVDWASEDLIGQGSVAVDEDAERAGQLELSWACGGVRFSLLEP
jgi:hypothetical protein